MTIRLLPQTLINQIAAGEVVERPASAVKELVENAIDASATKISVDLEEGGKDLIIITDNGCGMSRDELSLAVERHATSKLPEGDLMSIKTMGFRGEALPSLGAVSRLSLTSRQKNQDCAWKIEVVGGEKSEPIPAAHPIGTRVEVKDLFFATPARLKFMKTTTTELNHISEMVERLALAYPSVEFSLSHKKKTLFHFHSAFSVLERLVQIYGNEFKENTISVLGEREGYKVEGYIGLPTYNRNNNNLQQFFVNKRAVKDKILAHALKLSYHDLMAKDRYPVAVLYLTVPLKEVDVNVHPAKTEIRFLDAGLIRGLLISSIKDTLYQHGHKAAPIITDFALGKLESRLEGKLEKNKPVENNAFKDDAISPALKENFSYTSVKEPFKPGKSYTTQFQFPSQNISPQKENKEIPFEEKPIEKQSLPKSSSFLLEYSLGEAVAQLHDTYIVSQKPDSVVIVDQHAAHERLLYEQLKADFKSKKVPKIPLLIPEIIELKKAECDLLLEYQEELKALGLPLEIFGNDAVILREMPAILKKSDPKKLVLDLLGILQDFQESIVIKEKIFEILATHACHSSVRAGQKLSTREMNDILRQMETTLFSGQCNHGRPTYIELSLTDIEKLFGRR